MNLYNQTALHSMQHGKMGSTEIISIFLHFNHTVHKFLQKTWLDVEPWAMYSCERCYVQLSCPCCMSPSHWSTHPPVTVSHSSSARSATQPPASHTQPTTVTQCHNGTSGFHLTSLYSILPSSISASSKCSSMPTEITGMKLFTNKFPLFPEQHPITILNAA